MRKLWLLLSIPIIVFDQWVKLWAAEHLEPIRWSWLSSYTGDHLRFPNLWLPGLRFSYAENTGAAFSILAGGGARWFLVAASSVAAGLIIFAVLRKWITSNFGLISAAFLLGGAVGNLIDRIRLGYVIDMLEFTFIDFAIFNIADVFITIGGACLCLYLILDARKAKANASMDKHSRADGTNGNED